MNFMKPILLLTVTLLMAGSLLLTSTFLPTHTSVIAQDPRPPGGFTPTPSPVPPQTGGTSGSGPTIPEPTTVALIGLGVASLAGYAQRKRKAANDQESNETLT